MLLFIVVTALLLDKVFGEPKKYHPLVGFGFFANYIEGVLNRPDRGRAIGVAGLFILLTPILILAFTLDAMLAEQLWLHAFFSAFVLYITIGWQSLIQHATAITKPLQTNDLPTARYALSMIVSRDTSMLNEKEISKATTESVLENGADAIFSALFWFCVAGVPGVVLYRLSNTLDAMWGYKNKRFLYFGWAAARLDDALNYVPSRLTAFSYSLSGHFFLALACWRAQGRSWKSPNAGPVMSSGAGALNVSLGGEASYHGTQTHRPVLGPIETDITVASHSVITDACKLVNKALVFWVMAIAVYTLKSLL